MKTIELFSGTQSFSKVARKLGHETFCIDNNPKFNNDITIDLLKLNGDLSKFDIFWASPPCTTFSIASCSTHWTKDKKPKSEACIIGLKLLEHTIKLISQANPKYWFIENPRGIMRKKIDDIFKKYNITDYRRETICYCRYGDSRMKPTDIWTNCQKWKPIDKMCHNGNADHEAAPRGSKTGTQGLKGNMERSIIPPALFKEIFKGISK